MSKKLTPEERRQWAQKLGGLNEQYLYQCLTGRREMSPTVARRIETDSQGVITRQMLCQKTWQGIWPELATTQANPAQAATETVAVEADPVTAIRAGRVRRLAERRMQRQRGDGERRGINLNQLNVVGEA